MEPEYYLVLFCLLWVFGFVGFAHLVKISYGPAIIRESRWGQQKVFCGKKRVFSIPLIHCVRHIDAGIKKIDVELRDRKAPNCKDGIKADVNVVVFIEILLEEDSVMLADRIFGPEGTSDEALIQSHFEPIFRKTLQQTVPQFDFIDLYHERDLFRERLISEAPAGLSGYVIEDLAIDDLEQTDLKFFDPKNKWDAAGLKRIKEITAEEMRKAKEGGG